ncbi:S9 family peptidase [Actinacidiphila yeochonensis]|uniref:S9 family peptidase n=1 Tax=Actinacidiphila yeochonensis TaxID=89050 RepID=UPI00055E8A8A|nr:prolyl oligopeptidase family serine peptidase [Actinacidiphila yeochonensis]
MDTTAPDSPAAARPGRDPRRDAFPGQYARTQRLTLGLPHSFTLAPDGRSVLFLRSRGPEDRAGCLWLRDARGEHLLADPALLAGPGGEVPEAERTRRERARVRGTGITGYAADAALRRAVFALDGALWVLDLPGGAPRRVPAAGPVVDPRLEPGGHLAAYVTGGALHVVGLDEDGPADRALAEPEGPEVGYGLPEHVASESMHRYRGYWWAPDGRRLLVCRVDESPVQRWWIADPADPGRPPRRVAYPAAGTANAVVTLHVLDVDGGRTDVGWDRAAFEYVAAAGWDAHGPFASVQSRDQKTLRVLAVDPGTGATRVLDERRDPAWVQLVYGTPARTASGRLVHTADAGDTRHLAVDGAAVTPDGLQVREVVSVDGESVLFVASEEPTEEHLWSYEPGAPEGPGRLVRLSDGPGLHTGRRAGDGLLLHSHTPAGHTFRLLAGGTELAVESRQARPLLVPAPVLLEAGGLGIRTLLLLPSWHRPGSGALPVLMAPYGGPAGQLVVRALTDRLAEAQWFAEEGFAVVVADGRGTPGRGPRWERTVHKDSLSAPVEDQVTALWAAAAHCPDLDLGRVAVRGWSYGGTLAVAAVLRRPDVFHAAVSGAGPSDQRLYDTHWRERFLGHPDEDPAAYDRSSPISEAAALSRPLLLVHGMADDNVVAAHTLRLSAALLAAGRFHQVLPLSNATHAPSDPAVVEGLLRHQVEFLRQALNITPPAAV